MRQIPDESIDVAITSPPYYGLRDYGRDVIRVFGGNPNCKHKWQVKKTSLEHEYRQGIGSKTVKEKNEKGWHKQPSAFCSKCGAWKGQLGLEPHPQLYIKHLVEIFRELKRILKPGGAFYLNMGDTYCGSNQGYGQKRKSKTGFQYIGTGQYASSRHKTPQSQIIRKEKWLQPKQLMLMPARIATALQEDGWILRNDIIYHKRNPLPSSVKDRLTNTYEHVYFFVKSKKYYYDLDSIREPHTSIKDLGRRRLDTKTPKHDLAIKQKVGKIGPSGYLVQHPFGKNPGDVVQNSIMNFQELIKEVYKRLNRNAETYKGKNRIEDKNARVIQTFDGKKIRATARNILKEKKISCSAELIEYIHDHFSHPSGKNPGDFWTITVKPFPGAHFAVYPEEICTKPILSSCPESVCKKCGKPVMKKTIGTKGFGDSFNIRVRDMQTRPGKWGSLYKASKEEKRKYNEREYKHKNTKQETIIKCDCNAGFEAGIVLDMFAGSGTTGVVAKKFGRKYILIDLKKEYCEMARNRLKNVLNNKFK